MTDPRVDVRVREHRAARIDWADHLCACAPCRTHLRAQTGMCEAGRQLFYTLEAATSRLVDLSRTHPEASAGV